MHSWAMSLFFVFDAQALGGHCHRKSMPLGELMPMGDAVLKDQRRDKRLLEWPFKDIYM